ncbi:MAG TPA: ABC transporter substrate-binding protein [Gammaproteobacteria bacterium]|nr:ABC transporter substrate-binding protein [Gammaproteobacteria bacterium]
MNMVKPAGLIFGIVFVFFSQTILAADSPMDQLKSTIDSVITTLKDKSLDSEARRSKIRVLINDRFYFRAMSQRTLSRYWKKATPQQQKQFVSLFSKLLENTYVGRLEAYTNEKVVYLRERNKNAKRAVVYTQIETGSTEIPINYKLARKNDKWLIYDVVIEEVSLISNFRSSYAEIIKKEGMDGLLSKMEKKLAEVPVKTTNAS